LAPINALSDPADVVSAEAQLAPSTPSLAAPLVTFQGIRQFQDLWLSRLEACSQVSLPDEKNSNCRGNDPHSGWWTKGFGYFGHQDARDAFTEYDSTILGGMLAYDVPVGLDTRAGLGIGYGRSTIEGKTFDANMDFDTYEATAYIGHENGPWFVNGNVSFGWNEYSSVRHIVFPGVDRTANADYSGQDYTAFASTGYHFPVQKFTITPLASLQYSRVNLSDYTETGAGDINLKVDSQGYDFLESGLGVKVQRDFTYRGGVYAPEVHAKWLHELNNPALAQTAEFPGAGSSFKTPGLKTSDNTFNVGAGLTLLSCSCSASTWSIETVYDYNWTTAGYSANQVMARFTRRF
jgi:outer membrane autotransporter protein